MRTLCSRSATPGQNRSPDRNADGAGTSPRPGEKGVCTLFGEACVVFIIDVLNRQVVG